MTRLLTLLLTIFLASGTWSHAQADSLRTAKVLLRRMLTLDSLRSAKLKLCDAELAFTSMRYREALDLAGRQARETLRLADSLASLNARARLLNAEAIRLAEVNRGTVERLSKAVAREKRRRWLWIGLGAAGGLLLGAL